MENEGWGEGFGFGVLGFWKGCEVVGEGDHGLGNLGGRLYGQEDR